MRFILYTVGVATLLLFSIITQTNANDSIHSKSNSIIEISTNDSILSTLNADNNQNAFIADLVKAVINELNNSTVNKTDSLYNQIYSDNSSRSASVFLTIPSDENATLYHFSQPIASIDYDVVMKSGESINNMDDLQFKKVIVSDNLFIKEYLKNEGITEIDNFIFVPDMKVGLKMLSGEEFDAALCDQRFSNLIIENNNIPNLEILHTQLPSQNICFASTDYNLILAINKALDHLQQNGDYMQLYEKWYGNNDVKNHKWILWLIIILLCILLIGGIFYWYVKQKIKNVSSKLLNSNIHLQTINHLVSLSVDESEIKIFMFDVSDNQFYTFKDGDFVESYNENKEIDALIHPEDRSIYDKSIDEIMHSIKIKVVFSIRLYEKEKGRYIDYKYTAICIKDDNNEVSKIIYLRREEGRHKQLMRKQEEIIQNLETIVNVADVMRFYYDLANDTYRIVNSESNKYVYTRDEWMDMIALDEQLLYQHFIDNALLSDDVSDSIQIHIQFPFNDEPKLYKITFVDKQTKNEETVSLNGIISSIPSNVVSQSTFDEKKDKFYDIYNNLPIGAIFLDTNGVVRNINKYFSQMMEPDLLDQTIGKYNYFETSRITPNILKDIANGEVYNYQIKYDEIPESLLSKLDDILFHKNVFEISISAVFDESNQVIGYSLLFNDITIEVDEKEILNQRNQDIQNSEERLSLILNKLPIPVYITDPQKNEIVYINDAATKLFDTTNYKRIEDFVKSDDVELHRTVDRKILESGEEHVANELLRLYNGKEFDTFVRKILIEFDGKKQILVMRMDLTEQRKIQMINKILSASLPSLNAYTWFIDTRDNTINYGKVLDTAERDLNALNTMEKFLACIHEEDKEAYEKEFDELIEKGVGETSLCFRIDIEKIGEYKWWESRATIETVYDESGEPYKLLYGIDLMVDEQKRNELSLMEKKGELVELNKQNELILNNTTMGIVYLNSNYEVQWSNVESVFGGFEKGPCRNGISCQLALGEEIPCEICPIRDAVQEKCIKTYQFENNNRMFGVTAIPVDNGNSIEGIVLRIEDITERAKLINDLKKAKVQAEESDRLKMAFLANMSHEIRTPLNAIVGFSEMLQHTDDESERHEYIQIIKNNNELLLGLIGDVLDLSKIESGSIDIINESVDVIELLNETITVAKTRNSGSEIKLMTDYNLTKCVAVIDRNRFVQLCNNFLSNAYKYTQEGEITIQLDYIDGGISLSVKDTGIGIDKNKHHLVFQRFEKIDTFAQGTGLGLAICNAIIEAVGGKIGFESEEGVGSTFWIWIPCDAEVEYKTDELLIEETEIVNEPILFIDPNSSQVIEESIADEVIDVDIHTYSDEVDSNASIMSIEFEEYDRLDLSHEIETISESMEETNDMAVSEEKNSLIEFEPTEEKEVSETKDTSDDVVPLEAKEKVKTRKRTPKKQAPKKQNEPQQLGLFFFDDHE